MPYIAQTDIEDEIGGHAKLIEALDDAGTGVVPASSIARLLAVASETVDGYLQGRYIVPLSPVPAIAVEAALMFACEKLFGRRRQSNQETNPYTARADHFRERLKAISDRKESLNAAQRPAFLPGAVISTPSAMNGSSL